MMVLVFCGGYQPLHVNGASRNLDTWKSTSYHNVSQPDINTSIQATHLRASVRLHPAPCNIGNAFYHLAVDIRI
jgi:hypothetical protein